MTNISLSPTDSPAENAEMDTGAALHCQTAQVDGQQVGKSLIRLPADTPRTPSPKEVNFQQFCDQLRTDLPGDSQGRRSFDTRTRFVAGDPSARFGSTAPLEYEVTGEIGRSHWELIFEHVLGPHKEKTELLLFPISESTKLHHLHSTWAGTFVLTALVAVFPGINLVLLDSDCLPVTLFEVEDLWTEAYLARVPAHCESGIPQALCESSHVTANTRTQSRVGSTRMGQAALVLLEPHAELNAGLIMIFRSSHLFDWNAWSLCLWSSPSLITEDEFKESPKKPPIWPLPFGTDGLSS